MKKSVILRKNPMETRLMFGPTDCEKENRLPKKRSVIVRKNPMETRLMFGPTDCEKENQWPMKRSGIPRKRKMKMTNSVSNLSLHPHIPAKGTVLLC